jgi:hypothetical protein
MPPELWFGPNLGSVDLLDLFRYPERWATARGHLRAMQLYAQHILLAPDSPGAKQNGLNTWPSFRDVNAVGLLKEWGRDLSVEIGAVKRSTSEGGCNAKDNEQNAAEVIRRVADARGSVKYIAIDEALVAGLNPVAGPEPGCGLTLAQTVENTARFIRNLRTPHPEIDIGVIEAYPHNPPAKIIQFMEGLQGANASPQFLHLDVDRNDIHNRGMDDQQVSRDLRSLQYQCSTPNGWKIPFGVIMYGQVVHGAQTEAAYGDSVLRWVNQLHHWLGTWPDRLIVQSWEVVTATGLNTLPYNLTDSDPHSHTGLISAVQQQVATTRA